MLHSAQQAVWVERDRRWAQRVYRASQYRALLAVLRVVSWLGDGIIWYVLIGAIGLAGGTEGRDVAAQMLLVGAANLTIYLWLKARIGRPRPFVKCPDIRACGRALDRFSFPSGHALHATGFAIILGFYYPLSLIALVPLGVLIALSRIALGLHYPSDVAAGIAIGATTASLLLALY